MQKDMGKKIFVGAVILAVAAAAIGGLFVAGSPSQERARQFDARRINDLQQLSQAVDQYWTRNARLPEALTDLQNRREYYVPSLLDPRTQEAYEYRVTAGKTYEMCATFETDATAEAAQDKYARPYYVGQGADFWKHGQGRTCFTIEAQNVPGLLP
ncbi:hypothetical protein EPO33_00710 [Patescibacteria group bacterium]|nr:MAG: hypothetical protein EPO33_00710 [Patescibacteria group bacterium]